jgi:ribosome-associated protein
MIELGFEIRYKTSRSSGAGGQNVNKVSTKVELIFYVEASRILTEEQKQMIRERLGNRIRKDGAIHLTSQEARTQMGNKEIVTERFFALIEKALTPVKKRKKKKVSPAEKEKRLKEKKDRSQKKELRRKTGFTQFD